MCETFGIESVASKVNQQQGDIKEIDANEWIPTAAVKKIKEIQI